MATLSQESTRLSETERQCLRQIFDPISGDLRQVDVCLAGVLGGAKDRMLREIIDFLLGSPGKRIRPALVLLSAGAAADGAHSCSVRKGASIPVAAAVELIHMASLVHDDMIDGATVRHGRASVSARWGRRVAVAVGDHLCSHAMLMICKCGDSSVFATLGSRLSAMCEGELLQVAGRDRFAASEQQCLAVIEKKTAALFGACCEVGASVATSEPKVRKNLQQFGFHFGMAFQILDDCRDLLCDEQDLGKRAGQDLLMGDMTVPLLYAIRYSRQGNGNRPTWDAAGRMDLAFLRDVFRSSQAPARITELMRAHISRALIQLDILHDSDFTRGLGRLARHIELFLSDILTR